MNASGVLKKAMSGLTDPGFWLDALALVGGYKLTDVVSTYLGDALPDSWPNFLRVATGPVATFTVGTLVGGNRIGKGLKIGALVYAVDEILDAVGIGGLEA